MWCQLSSITPAAESAASMESELLPMCWQVSPQPQSNCPHNSYLLTRALSLLRQVILILPVIILSVLLSKQ